MGTIRPMRHGERVRRWRRFRGIPLKAMAKRAGLHAASLSRIENGLQALRVAEAEAIAAVCGVSVAVLLSSLPPRQRKAS